MSSYAAWNVRSFTRKLWHEIHLKTEGCRDFKYDDNTNTKGTNVAFTVIINVRNLHNFPSKGFVLRVSFSHGCGWFMCREREKSPKHIPVSISHNQLGKWHVILLIPDIHQRAMGLSQRRDVPFGAPTIGDLCSLICLNYLKKRIAVENEATTKLSVARRKTLGNICVWSSNFPQRKWIETQRKAKDSFTTVEVYRPRGRLAVLIISAELHTSQPWTMRHLNETCETDYEWTPRRKGVNAQSSETSVMTTVDP